MGFNPLEFTAKAVVKKSANLNDLNELDVNPIEAIAKISQRSFETIQDATSLLPTIVVHAPIVELLFGDLDWSECQRSNIMNRATCALLDDDISEAAYQYRRELCFSKLARNKFSVADDTAAKAGLHAIKQNANASAISFEVLNTLLKKQNETSAWYFDAHELKQFW